MTFLPSPTSTTCGSAQNLQLTVNTTAGAQVANGTPITFTTTLGTITTPVSVRNGLVYASLNIPPRLSGTADIVATGAGLTARKSITVTCVIPPPVPAPAQFRPAPPAPTAPAPVAAAPQQPIVAIAPIQPVSMAVTMREFSYAPSAFNVRAGQQVNLTVTNAGGLPHSFTIAGVTDTGVMGGGQTRTVSFNAGGPRTLTYFCTVHGAAAMSGRITVTP